MTKRANLYVIIGIGLCTIGLSLLVIGVWLYLGGYERWFQSHDPGFMVTALNAVPTATQTASQTASQTATRPATPSPTPRLTKIIVMTATPKPTGTLAPTSKPSPTSTPTPSPTPTPLTWRSTLLPLIESDPGKAQLKIPGLLVDAPITLIQPNDAGWDISQLKNDVGWLNGTGRFPNDERAIVLIAHNWVATGWRGPFVLLHLLKPGHKLSLQFQGVTYQYAVIAKEIVEADDIDALTSRPGNQLLLVTCWAYDAPNHRYLQRLVVVTELVTNP